MSLTSHLKDPKSPIGQFIRQHGSQTASITRITNPQLRSTETINPGFDPWVYGQLGMALDYRIRYFFAVTPSQQLVAYTGASMLPVQISESGYPIESPYSFELIEAFFTRLDAFLETIQPVGRQLEAEAERMLARYCFVLGLFEGVYRSGRYMDGLLMVPAPKKSVDELLAIADDAWIDDLCALSAVFYERGHHLLSLPFTLNPTFVGSQDVGGADADIIVNRCLIEIKSSIRARIDASWLHQLLGYLLLDYKDQQRFRSVAIYMARQGLLLTWPLSDFLRSLTGDAQISLAQLRQEFCALCQQQSREQKSTKGGYRSPTLEDQKKLKRHYPTAEEMQGWGYSSERIQWILKNQQISKAMSLQGYSDYEISQETRRLNPTSKEDLQRMGFPKSEINVWFPPINPLLLVRPSLGSDKSHGGNRRATRKRPKWTATYARWLKENQCFDLSTVPISCYRCGEGTVVSCSLCGVYVCNDCSEPDENDDSICFDCVAQGCKQGVHYHNAPWKYADAENSHIAPFPFEDLGNGKCRAKWEDIVAVVKSRFPKKEWEGPGVLVAENADYWLDELNVLWDNAAIPLFMIHNERNSPTMIEWTIGASQEGKE